MEQHTENVCNYSGKCFIYHSNCIEEAMMTGDAIKGRFPNISGEIRICNMRQPQK